MAADTANYDRYEAEFRRLHHEEMTTWTSKGPLPLPSPREKNFAGRYLFWGVPRRTIEWVMEHIAARGPPLYVPSSSFTAPAPLPNRWTSRRMGSSSSAEEG